MLSVTLSIKTINMSLQSSDDILRCGPHAGLPASLSHSIVRHLRFHASTLSKPAAHATGLLMFVVMKAMVASLS